MLDALRRTGWENYSLFLRPDGLVIGYFETNDLDAALDGMSAFEVNTLWQREMSDLLDVEQRAVVDGLDLLSEVFNLDDQLAAVTQEHTNA